MRKAVVVALLWFVGMNAMPAAFGADGVESRIGEIPRGARLELRLKDKQKVRGFKGPVSGSGFTVVDAKTGDREIAFADVVSVKQISGKSHLARNIVIAAVVAVAVVVTIVGIQYARCGPLGCHAFVL